MAQNQQHVNLIPFQVHHLGCAEYTETWQAMRTFTETRNAASPDQIWIVEHPPIFTLGQAGKRIHLLKPSNIPVVQTDRGGQITYHGPGQLIVYVLLDLKRLGLSVHHLVYRLEESVIQYLNCLSILAQRKAKAPGVYVQEAKIASLGLRFKKGFCYHGLSLNVNMDLSPFQLINPCGMPNQRMTQVCDFIPKIKLKTVAQAYLPYLKEAIMPKSAFFAQTQETSF